MLKYLKSILLGILLCSVSWTAFSLAFGQAPQPTPAPSSAQNQPQLERRIDVMEERTRHLEESVKANSDTSRLFIIIFSAFITLIIGIQGIFQGLILRHQWAREAEHDTRDKEKDGIANTGAKAVADVLGVVKDTMDNRLIQERKAQDEAARAKQEVESIRGELTRVVSHFERLGRSSHDRIESTALQLAKVRRHDFKEMPDRLISFAQQSDEYMTNLAPLASSELKFSSRVGYVRGIAAHYMSDPTLVRKFLTEVVGRTAPEQGETEFEHSRRSANAYYYLGVNESNFANYVDALHLLEKAYSFDPDSRDLLTRIVTAECYIFSGQLERGSEYIRKEIDASIDEMKKQDDFRSYHVPLQARTELLKANVLILEGSESWPTKVQSLLEPAATADPDSYYVLSSLAQAYHSSGDPRAAVLFDKAYECIVRRGHLDTITEVRSRILLLMVAGICSKMGSAAVKKRKPEEFLEEAKSLLDRLPQRDSDECTVFSPISRRNEDKTTVATHIGQIQSGIVIQVVKKTAAR